MMLDRSFKNELMACVRAILTRCLHDMRDENEEVWLREPEFLKQFGMFSPSWLKEYGKTLPRIKAGVYDENGDYHESGSFSYPRNKIQEMIRDGSIKQLKVKAAME